MKNSMYAALSATFMLSTALSTACADGRANFGAQVGPDGGNIEINVMEGTVLVRTIGTPGGDYHDATATLAFSEGNYQISAASEDANFTITWGDPITWSDGDITPVAIDATNASIHFGKGNGDREDLWFGTHATDDSVLSFSLHAFGSSDREFGWVNEVTNDGSFTMPAEADGETPTTFDDGDHVVNMNARSIVWVQLDGGGDGSGEGYGDGGGDGYDGLMIHFVEIDAASIQLTSSEIPEAPEEGDLLTRTITVDLQPGLVGDLDGDGCVTGADLGLLLGAWVACP